MLKQSGCHKHTESDFGIDVVRQPFGFKFWGRSSTGDKNLPHPALLPAHCSGDRFLPITFTKRITSIRVFLFSAYPTAVDDGGGSIESPL